HTRNPTYSYPSAAHPASVRLGAIQQSRLTNVNPTKRFRNKCCYRGSRLAVKFLIRTPLCANGSRIQRLNPSTTPQPPASVDDFRLAASHFVSRTVLETHRRSDATVAAGRPIGRANAPAGVRQRRSQ